MGDRELRKLKEYRSMDEYFVIQYSCQDEYFDKDFC